MSYSYQPRHYHPQEPRRSRAVGCLMVFAVLVVLVVVAAIAILLFVRPEVSKLAGSMIGNQLEQQLQNRIQATIGEGREIPADFAGEVVIGEGEINQYIAAHPEEISPLDTASVRFVPGSIVIDMSAYGVSGQAHAGLEVVNGSVAVVNPRIEGPLSLILDITQIAESLEQELNTQLTQDGKQVTAVSIEQGQIVAQIAPR